MKQHIRESVVAEHCWQRKHSIGVAVVAVVVIVNEIHNHLLLRER